MIVLLIFFALIASCKYRVVGFSCSYIVKSYRSQYQSSIGRIMSRSRLLAKQKSSKLVSDKLLFLLDSENSLSKDANINLSQSNSTNSNKSTNDTDKHQESRDTIKGHNLNHIESHALKEDASNHQESKTAITLIDSSPRIRKEKPSRVKFIESSQPDFVMLGLESVGLMFGNDLILKNATMSVVSGERVGLVGRNGGGKTTQLKLLYGDIEPSYGDVVKSSQNLRISFLRQEFIDELVLTRTLKDELKSSFKVEYEILTSISDCESEITASVNDPRRMENALERLEILQTEAVRKNVYRIDSKIEKIMDSIGFSPDDHNAPVSSFSGGWKMRIGLAKILLQDPNVVLLDEPTNHLDLDSVYWLESFLVKQNIPMVIVSHDREFLDKVCNKIVEIEEGITYTYKGNYSKYLQQRSTRLEVWRDQYEKQRKYVKEEENWIKTAKNDPAMQPQVRSREIALEKFKASQSFIEQPPKTKKFRFRFPPLPRCGTRVLECAGISHEYDNVEVLDNIDIDIDLGDRIGFVGPNGSGKSTMMRIMAMIEEPSAGYCRYGGKTVVSNYFEQNQADALDPEKTVLSTIQEHVPEDYTQTDTRTLLGQFMFKGDDVDKQIKYLSGGEKARVALCKMILQPSNLLLLDEPTNHLDIVSKEVLEEALQHYEGALVVISHDRYFMSQVAKKIFEFGNSTLTKFDMDYHDYMQFKGVPFTEKVVRRYVEGDNYKVTKSKPVIMEKKPSKTKNFGGSGVTCGNPYKGIKNAKRFM